MSTGFKTEKLFDFMGKRRIFVSFSIIITVLGLIGVLINPIMQMSNPDFEAPIGINWGIDFQSGTKLTLAFEKSAQIEKITSNLETFKKQTGIKFRPPQFVTEGIQGAAAQKGKKVDFRLGVMTRDQEKTLFSLLEKSSGAFEVVSKETVGPIVGQDLMLRALKAVLIASVLIFLYLWKQFEPAFALGALTALFHDVAVMISGFAFFGFEVNSPFVAAVLVVIGYSVNDTIVIFDRIRENAKSMRKATPEEVFNASISQTLGRSINTVMTVIIVLISIAIFGGATLRDFSLALLIGVITGGYSSICIASVVAHRLIGVKYMGGKISNSLAQVSPSRSASSLSEGPGGSDDGNQGGDGHRPASYQIPNVGPQGKHRRR